MYVTDSRGSVYAVNAADGHLLLDLRRHESSWRRTAGRLHLPQPRRVLCGRCRVRGGRIVSLCARRQDWKTGSEFRHKRSGERDPGRAEDPVSGRQDGDQHGVLVHHCAPGVQRRALYRQHAKRESYSGWPCLCRRREERQGPVALQHRAAGRKRSGLGDRRVRRGSAASAMAAESGKRRQSIPNWDCSTSRSGIRSATAGNAWARTCSRDSVIALALTTGKLAWHFQQTHHDVWDYDSGGPPILFDMQVRGQTCQGGGRGEQERISLHPEP